MLTFFGLTPEYKLELHDGIFSMVTYGKGGWTYSDVYNMPVFLRMYYMKKLSDSIRKESDSVKTSSSTGTLRPNIITG